MSDGRSFVSVSVCNSILHNFFDCGNRRIVKIEINHRWGGGIKTFRPTDEPQMHHCMPKDE
jgi:hypothetical protein